MSEIKGYTAEEVAKSRKNNLIEDYASCERKLTEMRRHEQETESTKTAYTKLVAKYRINSVNRVLDYIRSEYRAGRICDLETLLCHCQNKLNGNIDGIELDLDEHSRGVPFEKVGGIKTAKKEYTFPILEEEK